jgi:hypothetical protein
MNRISKTFKQAMNPSKYDWANAMTDRLKDQLADFDDMTKELIGGVFFAGLIVNEDVLEKLKSSSLIESDYFDDFTREASYTIRSVK